jgi:rhomboid protease GluP
VVVLDIIDKILRVFGTSRQRIRWRAQFNENQSGRRKQGKENKNRHLKYQNKMCSSCGGIVEREARSCPYCETRLPSWHMQALARWGERVLPGQGAMTSLLLLFNVLVFILMGLVSGEILSSNSYSLIHYGANYGPMMTAGGEWWRLISYNFLHGGLFHVGFNLYALSIVGPLIEDRLGGAKAFVIYLVSGILAGLISHMYSPLAASVGASGAILGLIGAGVVVGHQEGGSQGIALRNGLFKWFVFVVLFGLLMPQIDNAAHFGGFVAGAVLGVGLNRRGRLSPKESWCFRMLALGGVFLCATAFVLVLWNGRGYPSQPSSGEESIASLRRCEEAREAGEVEVAATLCDVSARARDFYGNIFFVSVAVDSFLEAGSRESARRVLAIFSATTGYVPEGIDWGQISSSNVILPLNPGESNPLPWSR